MLTIQRLVSAQALLTLPNSKQRLPELNRLAVGNEALRNLAARVRFNLVHQLHGFHNADHLTLFHPVAHRNKR